MKVSLARITSILDMLDLVEESTNYSAAWLRFGSDCGRDIDIRQQIPGALQGILHKTKLSEEVAVKWLDNQLWYGCSIKRIIRTAFNPVVQHVLDTAG